MTFSYYRFIIKKGAIIMPYGDIVKVAILFDIYNKVALTALGMRLGVA